jgi:hypothetical protein
MCALSRRHDARPKPTTSVHELAPTPLTRRGCLANWTFSREITFDSPWMRTLLNVLWLVLAGGLTHL